MAARSPNLNVMIAAAEKAGRALMRDFGEVEQLQISRKGPGDFVSNADMKAEKIIREELLKARPKFSLLMEEGGFTKGEDEDHVWISDPLDGTNNFLHGFPHWCVSIALERKKEVIAAVVHDPLRSETFYAEKGTGAFATGMRGRLRVSARQSLNESLVSASGETAQRIFAANRGCRTRLTGSVCLDMAYVAAGRLDGCVIYHIKPWEKAIGMLLIKESGGYVTETDGSKADIYGDGIVGGNPNVHQELLGTLKANT